MRRSRPRLLLLTEIFPARAEGDESSWQFVVHDLDRGDRQVERDSEPCDSEERLHLLSVVRGLQSLDQPAQVTLLTGSRFVCNGIRNGLESWRDQNWHWEHFGALVPVRHLDLWKRIDCAMSYHRVTARIWHGSLCRAQHTDNADDAALALGATSKAAARSRPQLRLFSADTVLPTAAYA